MEAPVQTKEATKRESEQKASEENSLQDRKEEQNRLEKRDRKRAIIGHQLQRWEDTTDVETYPGTFEEAMVEGEYQERKWLSILQKYLAGKGLQTYKEVATLGETMYKEVKEAMLERLGILMQQARKTLWLGKPKPEESPRTYWQPIIQAIANLKRVITDPEKAAEEVFQGALLNAYGKEILLHIWNCNTNSEYQTIEALTEPWEAKSQQERRKMLRSSPGGSQQHQPFWRRDLRMDGRRDGQPQPVFYLEVRFWGGRTVSSYISLEAKLFTHVEILP